MKKFILSITIIVVAVSMIILMSASKKQDPVNTTIRRDDTNGVVVMELFTSQGCSSCPSADRLLERYALKNDEHIIPIAFHVDYWNHLGWKDPFSSHAYSERQQNYASRMNLESVYTPQLVVNGTREMVGSDEGRIGEAIGECLQLGPALKIGHSIPEIKDDKVTVAYTVNPVHSGSVINAALVQSKITTQVRAGENRGLSLGNYNVVRDFQSVRLSNLSGTVAFRIPSGGVAREFSIVLFVQEEGPGKITGAVKIAL